MAFGQHEWVRLYSSISTFFDISKVPMRIDLNISVNKNREFFKFSGEETDVAFSISYDLYSGEKKREVDLEVTSLLEDKPSLITDLARVVDTQLGEMVDRTKVSRKVLFQDSLGAKIKWIW